MSQPWKLITIASFVVAIWLALVPTSAAFGGGTGGSQVVNCGPPLVTWIQGQDVGFDHRQADCPAASRVRLQQAWMTTAIGVAALAGHAYTRRIDQGLRLQQTSSDARRLPDAVHEAQVGRQTRIDAAEPDHGRASTE